MNKEAPKVSATASSFIGEDSEQKFKGYFKVLSICFVCGKTWAGWYHNTVKDHPLYGPPAKNKKRRCDSCAHKNIFQCTGLFLVTRFQAVVKKIKTKLGVGS